MIGKISETTAQMPVQYNSACRMYCLAVKGEMCACLSRHINPV